MPAVHVRTVVKHLKLNNLLYKDIRNSKIMNTSVNERGEIKSARSANSNGKFLANNGISFVFGVLATKGVVSGTHCSSDVN